MRNNLSKPCNACPFRKNSLGGYLGGVWTAGDLHRFVVSEQPFPCHKSMEVEGEYGFESEQEENYSVCAGSMLYSIKCAKRFKEKEMQEIQDGFRGQDLSNILSVPEFLEHHKNA